MHELIVTFADSPIRNYIIIEPDPNVSKKTEDHIIKINCLLDDNAIKVIEPIIQKRNLKIEKLVDVTIIL